MRVGHMQDARIAEALQIVNAGSLGNARQSPRQRGGAGQAQKIAAAHRHVASPPVGRTETEDYLISISFQAFFCSLAWKIDALASASASLDAATAASKLPSAAAFLAAASVAAVVVHWLRKAPACLLAASAAA